MEVALVYNMKKEESDVADGDIDPSSQNITDVSTQIEEKATSADTYAEWDTIETVTAVRDALALRHSVTMIEADEDAFDETSQPTSRDRFQYRRRAIRCFA